jgi:hypothetical protein
MPIIKTVRPITDEFLCRAWVDAADMQVLADLLLESNLVGKLPDTLYPDELYVHSGHIYDKELLKSFFTGKNSYFLEIECRAFILQTLKAARHRPLGLRPNSKLRGIGCYPYISFAVGLVTHRWEDQKFSKAFALPQPRLLLAEDNKDEYSSTEGTTKDTHAK